MKSERHEFKLGNFNCTLFQDAVHAYDNPASLLFKNAPRAQLTHTLQEHGIDIESWEQWITPYVCLLVKTGIHTVLIDTGIGSTFSPAKGKLLQHLETCAIRPEEIDFVLITHAHGDHCGGNTDAEYNPVFKQARYVMFKEEWAFWNAEETLAQSQHEWMIPVVAKNLKPIFGHFDLLEDDREIVPGVWAIKAPGHTPGHMVVRLSSEGEQLWYLSDAFLHPIHIEQPDWYAEVDTEPEQTIKTRKLLLNQIMTTQPLIQCFHFPFPGLGHVINEDQVNRWHPILSP
jgi:glyoxylase-like metal-dependent hydrolase (beta-lactamase superfamily II)